MGSDRRLGLQVLPEISRMVFGRRPPSAFLVILTPIPSSQQAPILLDDGAIGMNEGYRAQ